MQGKNEGREARMTIEMRACGLVCMILASGCERLLARLATPETLASEIEQFRQQALGQVDDAMAETGVVEGQDVQHDGAILRRARQHIEKLCAEWRGDEPGRPQLDASIH